MRARTLCAVWGCPDLAVDGARCDKHRRRTPQAFRRQARLVIARAHGHCEQCGAQAPLSAHHVRALVHGYDEIVTVDELLALCSACQRHEQPATSRGRR